MDKFEASTYGDRIADVYDARYSAPWEGDIGLLRKLAGTGRALELGIGTGRVALPLASSGVEVHGIDASEAMVAQMRKKPGGPKIPITIGNFAEFKLESSFSLIYVVFNTFFGLITQDEQISCFRSIASHLEDDGVFLVTTFIPDGARIAAGTSLRPTNINLDSVELDASTFDAAKQTITIQHVSITESGTSLFPVVLRYAYPPELDLMARLAGLRLRDRWGGWDKAPYGPNSVMHVSVYERAD